MTTAQLVEIGITREGIRRRVAAKRLRPLYRAVYAVGHEAIRPAGSELAAVLACGPEALSSHRTAGRRWGFVRTAATSYEVTAPRSRIGPKGVQVHRSRRLDPDDRAVVDAVPVTSVARTLLDLADVLSEKRLADAVHEAEVLRLFDLRKIKAAQARVPGRTGRHRLNRVLADYGDGPALTRNEAERRFLELIDSRHLPQPRTNQLLHGYEVDFHWPDHNLVVEVDGGAAHQTRKAFVNDRKRDRALAKRGIQVLRVAATDLDEGAADIATLLRR